MQNKLINYQFTENEIKNVLNHQKILIIDDFFTDLNLHKKILSESLFHSYTSKYPGKAFKLDDDLRKYFHLELQKCFGRKIILEDDTGWIASLTKSDQSKIKKVTHIDLHYCNLIVYLFNPINEIHALEQGTSFQRHKKTQSTYFDTSNKVKSLKQNIFYDDDCLNKDAWEDWFIVPAKLNRAVFFSGSLWHSIPQKTFGNHFHDGRITQNFFLRFETAQVV